MRPFPSLSATWRRLSPRERRVVTAGAIVGGLALLAMRGVVPFVERWSAREGVLAAKAGQLARLQAVVADEARLREAVAERQRRHAGNGARLLPGGTAALAGSSLQALLSHYAEVSRVALDRIEILGGDTAAGGRLVTVPAQLSGRADVYGLVDLLRYLQTGERLLVIDDVRVTASPADHVLLWSVRVHGVAAVSEAGQ